MTGDVDGFALGIDIGGTFTDVVLYEPASGRYFSHKELTTPDDPAAGVISGLQRLFSRAELSFGAVTRTVHATTLFTNALIERKGALTGLITTAGFRDILEIGHERKYELYDIFLGLPQPLVRRSLRREVPERMTADGRIAVALDEEALLAETRALIVQGVESVAVMFLHAYANPRHEQRARDVLVQHFPDLLVSISSDIAPQIREFERCSTTVANAYIAPLASRYLQRLGDEMQRLGITSELFLMLSNGGLTNLREARRRPVEMLESGPAAGALSAAWFGARAGLHHVLAFDMGGTTAKLSVIDEGQPRITHGFEAAREQRFIKGSGLPVSVATVELIEIGAGGGSIAHLDDLGLLKVGPQSAGSQPGPACYERGGTRPTVTDANLLLGYLNPTFFAGGTMPISIDAASQAVARLADNAQLDPIEIARGIHDLVNEAMASAARVHIAEQGHDPRHYALLTTGGGGPLHGCEVARKLGIRTVLCPPSAGVASALGLLIAPARIDRAASVVQPLDTVAWPRLEARFAELEADARQVIAETGIDAARASVSRFADLRYAGQGFELVVGLQPGPYGSEARAEILRRFETAYCAIYGRTPPRGAAELINIRVSVQTPASQDALRPAAGRNAGRDPRKGSRRAYFGLRGTFLETPVYDRQALPEGTHIQGPALIEEPESTLLLPPDCTADVQPGGNILVTIGGEQGV